MNFQELYEAMRDGRSYNTMAARTEGVTPQRLQQLATGDFKAFPRPDVIRALADLLGVSERNIVLAFARSLDLDVEDRVDSERYGLAARRGNVKDTFIEGESS